MIRFLPSPYPDELLWSVFARAARRLRTPSHGAIARLLSGSRTAVAIVDLPVGLDRICKQVCSEHKEWDADQLIANHTMLPLYAPFLRQSQLQQIKTTMHGNGRGSALHLQAGISASKVRTPERMRYCPVCVANDLDSRGESYWRRTHQAPGVEVCPHHEVLLESSLVKRTQRQTRHAYDNFPDVVPAKPTAWAVSKSRDFRLLLQISKDAHWLLNENRSWAQTESLRRLYREKLAVRDLAIYEGRLRLKIINQELSERYSKDLLARLECSPTINGAFNWLPRLLRSRRAVQSPLYHLVLMNFLEIDARSLFARFSEQGPFGDPGWPCLNPACSMFRVDNIVTCKLGHDEKGVMLGIFCCPECGYTYARRGPDRDKSAKEHLGWTVKYGPKWEAELQKFWEDLKLSLREIARRLRVDPLTIKRAAARLGLSFPRIAKRPVRRERRSLVVAASKNLALERTKRREEWQDLADKHPTLSRTQLRILSQATYAWLYRHDRQWLMAGFKAKHNATIQLPERRKLLAAQRWSTRDAIESSRVRPLANEVRQEPGKPMFMCRTALARRLGILTWIENHPNKLPRTIEALNEICETREEFALRRIVHASKTSAWQSGVPKRWLLLRLAGIRKEIAIKPCIEQCVHQAIARARGVEPREVGR